MKAPAVLPRKQIVLLGMMSKLPVPGVVWLTLHYLIGLKRLGYQPFYVEAHANAPSMLMMPEFEDLTLDGGRADAAGFDRGSKRAASYIHSMMRRFDLGSRWAFLALHDNGRCYGMSWRQLQKVCGSAALVINLHGGTEPLPELFPTDRLVFLETDPVELQVELHNDLRHALDFLEPHCAFFTWAENYGNPDCKLPVDERFPFRPTRPPVVLDFWRDKAAQPSDTFTTVGNWKQRGRDVTLRGERYGWSKHQEFLKFLDLPSKTPQPFELALASCDEPDQRLLKSKGWRVRGVDDLATDLDAYRDYIARSRGEFTVAKDQNVRLRTGWFSDRATMYLATGRPVVSQDTGFSNVLPTGEGLFGFSTMEEIVEAIETINSDYERHRRGAAELAASYFSHDVVLTQLLADLGVDLAARRGRRAGRRKPTDAFPADMVLTPTSRRPIKLPKQTVKTVMKRKAPSFEREPLAPGAHASVVVVTCDNLVFTRLCLESLLAGTDYPGYEVIVVDNGSGSDTTRYLHRLAKNYSQVRVVLNGANLGFPRACNQGLRLATGEVLVLLNNDTMVAPTWLTLLAAKLEDPEVGLVGAVTGRIGNEAEIEAPYRTWGEFLTFAADRARKHDGETFDIPTATMFCLAMRRGVYQRIGPIDERFEIGLLEDDDYSIRARDAGYRVVCADDVFVHHFGEASFGKLVPTGQYASLLTTNRQRFEEKWGTPWEPYGRRPKEAYGSLTERIRRVAAETIPAEATVLVVSRGDEELLKLDGCQAWHFPQARGGIYAGHHPTDSREAISHLEALRARGGRFLLIPKTGFWWLDHYSGLRRHLDSRYRTVVQDEETCVIYELGGRQS